MEHHRHFKKSSARAIGSFIPKLTRKVFEKHGFPTAALLTDWATIVGRDLARYTQPERLKWPHMVNAGPEADGSVARRSGATLLLRVEGARALDVQYQLRPIIERINAYFGYLAVADMRLLQAPVEQPDRSPRPGGRMARGVPSQLVPDLPAIQHEGLKGALERLHANLVEKAPAA